MAAAYLEVFDGYIPSDCAVGHVQSPDLNNTPVLAPEIQTRRSDSVSAVNHRQLSVRTGHAADDDRGDCRTASTDNPFLVVICRPPIDQHKIARLQRGPRDLGYSVQSSIRPDLVDGRVDRQDARERKKRNKK